MYDAVHQIEPWMPAEHRLAPLRERAAALAEASFRLSRGAHPTVLAALRELLRSMNSYYSNRIEGQSTHPLNIERALRRDFSAQPEVARLQRVAAAHIEAERALEAEVDAGTVPLGAAFLLSAHRALYVRLDPADRTIDGHGVVEPGALRERDVVVGRHVPPAHAALSAFLQRFDAAYTARRSLDTHLVAIACAHQRSAWIHPFVDGNGRAARLQTHCALRRVSGGLWSANRGFARDRDRYDAMLANADGPRRGALDGRGNLTEAGLVDWVEYVLEVCEDQVAFMARMLDLDDVKRRLMAFAAFRAAQRLRGEDGMRVEAVLPLHYAFTSGPMERAEFRQLTGLGERTARALLAYLLRTGLMVSDTPLGPVRLGLPLDALQFLFPALYPEAATPP